MAEDSNANDIDFDSAEATRASQRRQGTGGVDRLVFQPDSIIAGDKDDDDEKDEDD